MARDLLDKESVEIRIPNITINSTDIQILIWCNLKPHSIEELRKKIDIAYKNLLPHLKKLEQYRFIKIKSSGMGKKKEIVTNIDNPRVVAFVELLAITPEVAKEVNKIYKDSKKKK